MTLNIYPISNARISSGKIENIRFDMSGSEKLITVDLPIDVMQREFGTSKSEPLAQFGTHREVIEATASRVLNVLGSHNNYIEMKDSDFENRGSRALLVSGT